MLCFHYELNIGVASVDMKSNDVEVFVDVKPNNVEVSIDLKLNVDSKENI